jgi:hypothetical protein
MLWHLNQYAGSWRLGEMVPWDGLNLNLKDVLRGINQLWMRLDHL